MFIWILIIIRCVLFAYALSLTLANIGQFILNLIQMFVNGGKINCNFILMSIVWGLFLFSFYIEKLIV